MIMKFQDIRKRLRILANKEKAKVLQGFFKTGPGQYGEGDIFLGITVPILRKLVKECRQTCVADAVRLLRSPIHEERLLALFLLIQLYEKGDESIKKKIYSTYLKNAWFVNNWDLVDLSAPNIAGDYLWDKKRDLLFYYARSSNVWKRRIAVVATFYFIKQKDFQDTLLISRALLEDTHDLIHKAAGWMLREVGKRDQAVLEGFLRKHYQKMPRTMLRYAIERFPESRRQMYLKGTL
jgi:3-methyladenine DNA glycosylase AlkD